MPWPLGTPPIGSGTPPGLTGAVTNHTLPPPALLLGYGSRSPGRLTVDLRGAPPGAAGVLLLGAENATRGLDPATVEVLASFTAGDEGDCRLELAILEPPDALAVLRALIHRDGSWKISNDLRF